MLPYKSSSRSAKYVRWCDSCSLATPMQRAELNTARQSSHKSPARDDDAGGPPIVISTEAKRSGEISPSDGTGGITVGDLSTQSIMGAVPVCLPYRHVPPLEMTMLASTSGHTFGVRVQRVHKVQRVQRVVVAASPQILKKPVRALRHFDRSEAEWRNLLSTMVHEAWRQEISGLRVSLEPCIPARYPLEMTRGGP